MLWYLLVGIGCLLLGYSLGSRRGRIVKKRALQQLNTQSLELLDAKSDLNTLQQTIDQQPRNENVLKLALQRLQQAELRCRKIGALMRHQKRKHYIDVARLKLRAVESNEKALRAAAIARQATIHLQRLERASPITQTIEAPAPKSYGIGDPVTVSVVDQPRLNAALEIPSTVSNRDSDRLRKLRSSNEATAQAIAP